MSKVKALTGWGKAFLKSPKTETVYRLKDPKQLIKGKINQWSSTAVTEAGSGVTPKYTKSGKPSITKKEANKSDTKKALTKAKGYLKVTSPVATMGLVKVYLLKIKKTKKIRRTKNETKRSKI